VSAWLTPEQILIEPHVWNRQTGFFSASEPVVRLEPNVDDETLGHAIAAVLDAHAGEEMDRSREEVARSKSLLRAAGVKRRRDFDPGARCVSVSRTAGKVLISPSRNETTRHPRSGWFWIRPFRDLDGPTPDQLGTAVRLAFADCTFAPPIRRRTHRVGNKEAG
jgi:hypothetical protein